MLGDHRSRGLHQIARAGIIAQPCPGGHDVLIRRGGETHDIGPARHPGGEAGSHRRHRGLLQHDLGQPDPIRIGRLPGLARQGRSRAWRSYQASSRAAGVSGDDECLASTRPLWHGDGYEQARPRPQEPPPFQPPPRGVRTAARHRRRGLRRFGFVQSAIVSRWPDIVGPRLSTASAPNRSAFRRARSRTAC